jgi:hypothetical protein
MMQNNPARGRGGGNRGGRGRGRGQGRGGPAAAAAAAADLFISPVDLFMAYTKTLILTFSAYLLDLSSETRILSGIQIPFQLRIQIVIGLKNRFDGRQGTEDRALAILKT